MHGLPCIICEKISKIANVFVVNRQKQSFNGYSPIGSSKRTYRLRCLKFIILLCNYNHFLQLSLQKKTVNDKLHYNKTCSIAYLVQAGYQFRASDFLLD